MSFGKSCRSSKGVFSIDKVCILVALLLMFFLYCKTNPTTPDIPTPPPPDPTPQKYRITAEHCILDIETTITKSVVPGENIAVSISEVNIPNVDEKWIAAFEPDGKEFITIGREGTVTIPSDKDHSEYRVMVFPKLITNQGTGITPDYGWMYDQNPKLYNSTTNHSIYRKDFDGVTKTFGLQTPDPDWQYVIQHFQDILSIKSRGTIHINTGSDHSKDDFSYGYAICLWNGQRVDGLHGGNRVVVDPERLFNTSSRRATALEELFEQLAVVQNPGGHTSRMIIQSQGVPNDNLTYLLHFVYAIKAGLK